MNRLVRKSGGEIINLISRSFLGPRIAKSVVGMDPQVAVEQLWHSNRRFLADADIANMEPTQNFEDLAWLFSCNKSNRGIVRLDFSEAAYLFKLARSLPGASLLEIGRFDGGSTILFATALTSGSKLTSIDIAPRDDKYLADCLKTLGLSDRVDLVIGDANEVEADQGSFDLIFIDGDHSYNACKSDFEHWSDAVKIGGHLLFHDCDESEPGVQKVVAEIESQHSLLFKKIKQVSSLVDFIKL